MDIQSRQKASHCSEEPTKELPVLQGLDNWKASVQRCRQSGGQCSEKSSEG